MKKYIMILIVIFVIMVMPVSSRAGGGSSGGSSGSGGSHSHHSHTESRGYTYPIVGIVPFIGMIGVVYYIRHEKIRKMKKQAKNQLEDAYSQDEFWDESELKKKVKDAYYCIQKAWSEQDLDVLKNYLTDDLYKQWEIKIEWQKFKNERNELSQIFLVSKHIVSVYDDEDNTKDYFWVAIEGKMNDVMIRDDMIESQNNEMFIEYWKFVRNNDCILLDQILQEDEWEYVD